MVEMVVDQTFKNGFKKNVTGDGYATSTEKTLKFSGGVGNRALYEYHFPIGEFTVIEASVLAKSVQGETRFGVDLMEFGTTKDTTYTSTSSKEWERLSIKVVVPPNGVNRARVVLGKWASQNEIITGEFKDLHVSVSNFQGSPIVLAQGFIRVQNGVAEFRPSYRAHGVKSFSPVTDKLTIELESKFLPDSIGEGSVPHIQISPASENGIPFAGAYDQGKNSFDIKWSDGMNLINMATQTAYCWMMVTI